MGMNDHTIGTRTTIDIEAFRAPGATITRYTAFRYGVQVIPDDPLPPADDQVLVEVSWPDGRKIVIRFDGSIDVQPESG